MFKSVIKNFIFTFFIKFFPLYSQRPLTSHIWVTTFTQHSDINLLIWSLNTFFFFTKHNLSVAIWHTNNLTTSDIKKLKHHFHCQFINSYSLKNKKNIIQKLKKYHNLLKFRFDKEAKTLRFKLDSILLAPSSKFIYLDSDIIFYSPPKKIISWINHQSVFSFYTHHLPYPPNYYHRQEELINFSFRKLLFANYHQSISPTFNSGLLCIHNLSQINLTSINKIMSIFYSTDYSHHYLAEETSLSFMFNGNEFKALNPHQYLNSWCPEEFKDNFSSSTVSSHFSAESRCLYQLQAIKLALKNHFFKLTN